MAWKGDRDKASAEILERISKGESLRSVCRDDQMPCAGTFLLWVSKDDALAEHYSRAMQSRAHYLFEQIVEIADADDGDWVEVNGRMTPNPSAVQRAMLKVNARKWAVGRMHPRKYGDRHEIEVSGKEKDGSIGVTFKTVYEKE